MEVPLKRGCIVPWAPGVSKSVFSTLTPDVEHVDLLAALRKVLDFCLSDSGYCFDEGEETLYGAALFGTGLHVDLGPSFGNENRAGIPRFFLAKNTGKSSWILTGTDSTGAGFGRFGAVENFRTFRRAKKSPNAASAAFGVRLPLSMPRYRRYEFLLGSRSSWVFRCRSVQSSDVTSAESRASSSATSYAFSRDFTGRHS